MTLGTYLPLGLVGQVSAAKSPEKDGTGYSFRPLFGMVGSALSHPSYSRRPHPFLAALGSVTSFVTCRSAAPPKIMCNTNPMRDASVESHSCAKNAQEWATRRP